MYQIELIGISKTYIGSIKPAVNNIFLQVKRGDIITFVGPSGCGKTTTLRLIAGFEKPDKGIIFLAGQKVVGDDGIWIPPEKRGIGMVFQEYALFPHLTVMKNISFGLKKEDDKRSRVLELLELVGLSGLEKRYPHEISGGQQQRVALARALAPKPVVVLLDEPFSNLDAGLKKYVREEIKDILKTEGVTAVFVTHDQKDALAISDYIAIMKEGAIEQFDTPRQVFQKPATEFAAGFFGHTNILSGLTGEDGRTVITPIGKIDCSLCSKLSPGCNVKVSLRPDCFFIDHQGSICANVKKMVFAGVLNEYLLEINLAGGEKVYITANLPSFQNISVGGKLRLGICSEGVAVIA